MNVTKLFRLMGKPFLEEMVKPFLDGRQNNLSKKGRNLSRRKGISFFQRNMLKKRIKKIADYNKTQKTLSLRMGKPFLEEMDNPFSMEGETICRKKGETFLKEKKKSFLRERKNPLPKKGKKTLSNIGKILYR